MVQQPNHLIRSQEAIPANTGAGLYPCFTEEKPSQHHLLMRPFQKKNLFEAAWWQLIDGKEHLWARALTSSQCFAVNLFAPLFDDPVLAAVLYQKLFLDRKGLADCAVRVCLEFAPEHAKEWLGESGQTPRVDACFIIERQGRIIGYTLVEVKLTESAFGSCRGARPIDSRGRGNPDRGRCDNFDRVRDTPWS